MEDHRHDIVYRRLLSRSGHGYPLWIPNPDDSLPLAYINVGISVGDVGLLTDDGAFDFLFNIHACADHEVNNGNVPLGFQPLVLPNDSPEASRMHFVHKERSYITSSGVATKTLQGTPKEVAHTLGVADSGFQFSTDKARAAVLILPNGAHRYVAKSSNVYERYAIDNAVSWYQHVYGTLGRGTPNGSLYLVTGCDKCSSWGISTVSRPDDDPQVVTSKFIGGSLVDRCVSFTSMDPGIETRCFPQRSTASQSVSPNVENQCIFVRGVSIAVKESFIRRSLKVHVMQGSGIHRDVKPSSNLLPLDHAPIFPHALPFQSLSPNTGKLSRNISKRVKISHDEQGCIDDSTNVDVQTHSNENLSSRLSTYLLAQDVHARVAIVTDESWMSLLASASPGSDITTWDDDTLFKAILERYNVDVVDGIAQFTPQANGPLCQHISPILEPVLCLYEFHADEDNCLSFDEGEILDIITQNDNGWWAAVRQNGDVMGWIPSTFVQSISSECAERLRKLSLNCRIRKYEIEQAQVVTPPHSPISPLFAKPVLSFRA